MRWTSHRLGLLLLVGVLLLSACSLGSDTSDPTPTPSPAPSTTPEQGLGPTTGSALWAIGGTQVRQVSRIDPQTLQVTGSLAIDESLWSIAVTPGAVWIGGDRLHRIDRATGQRTTVMGFAGDYPLDMAVAAGTLWILVSPTWSLASDPDAPTTGRLLGIDPASGETTAEIALTSNHPWHMAVGDTAIWVLAVEVTAGAPTDYRVLRVDTAARQIGATIPLDVEPDDFVPDDIAADSNGIWVTTASTGGEATLRRIDSNTNQLADSFTLDDAAGNLVAAEGTLWVLGWNSSAVSAVDPATGRVRGSLHVEGRPSNVTAGLGAIWVTSFQGDERLLSRIDPATYTITATAHVAEVWKVVASE